MKDDKLYLIHILECIERINNYVENRAHFFADVKTQDAVLRNLHIMAESTQRLSDELKEEYPVIPWSKISGFRNILVHNYLGISLQRVWEVMESDLPELRVAVEEILQQQG